MLAIINGDLANTITIFKGSDDLFHVFALEDDGSPVDLTGATVSLEIYSSAARSDTVTKSVAGALVTAAAGYATVTLTDVDLDFGPGTFYGWLKVIASGGAISFGAEAVKLTVK